MQTYDYVIRGGRVIDPASGIDGVFDVAIRGGRIADIGRDLPLPAALPDERVYDATGQVITPGLVDLHTHVYEHATPLGIDADTYCLRRGTTTVVDAGSAGYLTFPGLRHHIAERVTCRVLAFLHISSIGLSASGLGGQSRLPGELESLAYASVSDAAAFIEENRDMVVGIKIRLSASVAAGGRYEEEGYRRAMDLADRVGLPLMVHHAMSTVPLAGAPGRLRAGDIYTHCYHGFPQTIIDPTTRRVDSVVRRAYERGVLFDVGSGQGSFNWTVSELALKEGLLPHTVSTDLHIGTMHGPTYDLPTVMTRLLHLGIPLTDLVRMTTLAPARAIGWDDRIGTLGIGRSADITALAVEPVDIELEDCQSQMRHVHRRIVAKSVWKDGRRFTCAQASPWPNPQTIERQRPSWSRLVIRDEVECPGGTNLRPDL